MTKIDLAATAEKMKVVNKSGWLREMAVKHPEDTPLYKEIVTAFFCGKYPLHRPRAVQLIGYMRESGYLVEKEVSDDHQAAA